MIVAMGKNDTQMAKKLRVKEWIAALSHCDRCGHLRPSFCLLNAACCAEFQSWRHRDFYVLRRRNHALQQSNGLSEQKP